jgi:ribosomal protein L12E/L44/L45/RPP1/RPP2
MKVIAAYLLAHLGGKSSPSSDDISKILSSGAFNVEFTALQNTALCLDAHFKT